MKTALLFFLPAFLLTLSTQAQKAISNSINPKIGQHCVFVDFDSTLFEFGDAGENVTWDFNFLQTGDTTTLYYVDPAKTPYHNHYPQANIAMTTDNQLFDYFLFTDTAYYSVGSIGCNVETKARRISHYAELVPSLYFPTEFASLHSDIEYRLTKLFEVFDVYSTLYTTTEVDAYGTLNLNGHTYHNAIRVKQEIKFLDFFTDYERYMTQEQIQIKYIWFVNELSAPLLTIDKSSEIVDGDTTSSTSVQILLTSIAKTDVYPFGFYLVYDSNATEYVFNYNAIKAGKFKIVIRNAKGKKIAKSVSVNLQSGQNEFRISALQIEKKQSEGLFEFKLKGRKVSEILYFNKCEEMTVDNSNQYFRVLEESEETDSGEAVEVETEK